MTSCLKIQISKAISTFHYVVLVYHKEEPLISNIRAEKEGIDK